MRLLPMGARMNGSSSCAPRIVVFKSHAGIATAPRGRNVNSSIGLDVVAQRHFRVGAAVDVIEDDARQPAFRQPPEVADVEHVRRIYAAGHPWDSKPLGVFNAKPPRRWDRTGTICEDAHDIAPLRVRYGGQIRRA